MLFLDGVVDQSILLVFRSLPPPGHGDLQTLVETISRRVGAYLEREGLLVRDIDNTVPYTWTSRMIPLWTT